MVIQTLARIKYVFFIGHQYGYNLLKYIISCKKNINIAYIFIEKDSEHEQEKYYNKIEALCCQYNYKYTNDLSMKNQLTILKENSVDFILVYGYRRLIKKEVCEEAQHGAIAMHYAMLPKYRGFAPVNWAIINGENETGVSLFFLTEGIDDGDIIEQKPVSILVQDDINTVLEKCNAEALKIFDKQFDLFENGIINRLPQDHSVASYTCARSPEDGLICWDNSTIKIHNLIRALTYPFPCAYTYLNGEIIHIIDAEILECGNYIVTIPGKIISRITEKGAILLNGDCAFYLKIHIS
ncbi:methionyl-tRNA formyltransferase [Spirochaetia bacterium]|nr:methionyl-tRNA formyltransferase [Spirochaetia bacterium]